MTFRVLGVNLGIPFKETIGDGLYRVIPSFPENQQVKNGHWEIWGTGQLVNVLIRETQ